VDFSARSYTVRAQRFYGGGGNGDFEQDAQLSQRDRAAGRVIVVAKSGRLEIGDKLLRR